MKEGVGQFEKTNSGNRDITSQVPRVVETGPGGFRATAGLRSTGAV
jgi:hypothetical protein